PAASAGARVQAAQGERTLTAIIIPQDGGMRSSTNRAQRARRAGLASYRLRPIVLEETGKELSEGNFNRIITDYEDECGKIPGMSRERRGSIYHPHIREDIPLGTLTVEKYERPPWTFNKLVYVEKEGFSEALKDNGWPERHDCLDGEMGM